jgi:hypothetical protein
MPAFRWVNAVPRRLKTTVVCRATLFGEFQWGFNCRVDLHSTLGRLAQAAQGPIGCLSLWTRLCNQAISWQPKNKEASAHVGS